MYFVGSGRRRRRKGRHIGVSVDLDVGVDLDVSVDVDVGVDIYVRIHGGEDGLCP